ncbi:hypothetical protein K438DRAFT_1980159 [Mycena galopus ATCC 62051]|nr:hypothetical protein K438DRAFT_1980159 [Mycena galopus ATCC 62051]
MSYVAGSGVQDRSAGGEKQRSGDSAKDREPQVEGAEKMLAPAPLLANLGKASANAHWMELTMQVTFNGQERTLREIIALALSAGWKVVCVTKAPGSLFGHLVAVPVVVPILPQRRAHAGSGSTFFDVGVGGAVNSGVGPLRDADVWLACVKISSGVQIYGRTPTTPPMLPVKHTTQPLKRNQTVIAAQASIMPISRLANISYGWVNWVG